MTEQNDVLNVSSTANSSNVDFGKGEEEKVDESSLDSIDEEIVAYLDGELAEEDRQDFERRLESDVKLKERFETHRSTWDALNLLVGLESKVDVAGSTVERLNSETQREIAELNARNRRRKRFFLTVCAVASCAFAILGFCLFSLFFPDVQKQRLKDRNVVSRLAQLEAIGDFEYLVALSQEDFFAKSSSQVVSNSENASNPTKSREKTEIERSYKELQDRSFYRLQQRFERLDAPSKKRWRLLWKRIEEAPNRSALLKTLDEYSEWLTNIANDEERDRLQSESVSERIADVRRKNEELARFWARFPSRPQGNGSRILTQTDAKQTNKQQEKGNEKNASFSPNDSAPSTPFATPMLTLRSLLPEELRREDFRSVYQKYELFRRNDGLDEKDNDGILDFLKSESNVDDSLSENARKYLASLPDDERRSALSLITALCVSEKNASNYYWQNAFRRQSSSPSYGFRKEGTYAPFGNFIGRQDASIRELANDLRNANSNVRDYITSRPSQEAQALLFGLHWGGERIKFGLSSQTSNPAPLDSNDSHKAPSLPQAPTGRFTPYPTNDQKIPSHTRRRENEVRS